MTQTSFVEPPKLKVLPPIRKSYSSPEAELRQTLADYTWDPLSFVRFAYPWGEKDLESSFGPYEWQREELAALTAHLKNPTTRYTPFKDAIASGHGIGKTALIAMVINWGMSTCEDCKIVVTAGTGRQLSTKTAPEVAKWTRMAINAHWWDVQATSIRVLDPKHQQTWRTDFLTWNETTPDTWSGLHNRGKRIIVIYDEASAIADPIYDATEGALTDERTEIIWLVFGNPLRNSGRFYKCFGAQKHRWRNRHLDARQVENTNKTQIQAWEDDWGADSDFFRVRVRGEFPRAASTQFISSELVEKARARKLPEASYFRLPKIMAVDVARFGSNESVIGTRQGRMLRILKRFRGVSTDQLAEHVIECVEIEHPDIVVVDGDGVGGGVVDHLVLRGYGKGEKNLVYEFHGGVKADDDVKYFNKRSECWGALRDWVATAQLPDDVDLDQQLTTIEYGFTGRGQIQLEKKDDLVARGEPSPDLADMAAMTFGVKLAAARNLEQRKPKKVVPVTVGRTTTSWMA